MLDLNTRVNFDEVMPAHLVNQELSGTGIPVSDALRELDGIRENGLANLFGEVSRGRDLDDLLVATLHGAVTLKEVYGVALGVSEELHLNVARALKETLDEDGADGDDAVGRAVDDDDGVVGARRRAEGVELRAPGVLAGVCDDGEDGEDVEVAALVV